MKRKLKLKLLEICSTLIRVKPNTILIIETAYPSGSNTKLVYERLKDNYDVDVLTQNSLGVSKRTFGGYCEYFISMIKLSRYHYIICTHGFRKLNKRQVLIDLWHGIVLKSMLYMESSNNLYKEGNFNSDYLIVSSKLEALMIGACTHLPFSNQKIMGSPRNDYLIKGKMQNSISDMFTIYDKIIIYMPTFRQGFANRIEGKISDNIFSFEDFDEKEFGEFLRSNNYLFILKLHPMEEKLFKERLKKCSENIMFMSAELLLNCNLDLYQILPHTDMLITDYSGVYFDYLLLDKPMIFINNDIEEYREKRGLMLEPYDFWTPGDKVDNQSLLQASIMNNFISDEYSVKRVELKEIFHLYQDGKSTERVVNFIDSLIKANEGD